MYLKFSPLSHHLSSHLMDTFWPNMWCTESEAADATHWHRVDLTCDQWTEGTSFFLLRVNYFMSLHKVYVPSQFIMVTAPIGEI